VHISTFADKKSNTYLYSTEKNRSMI
jgi:hypothetical protein